MAQVLAGTPRIYGRHTKSPAILIEGARTNLAQDSEVSSLAAQSNWDTTKNGTQQSAYWGGYNPGVASPELGYHAHVGVDRDGGRCIRFVNKNSEIGQKYRWMGVSTYLGTGTERGISVGTTVTVSGWALTDHIDQGLNLGLFAYRLDTGVQDFEPFGNRKPHFLTAANRWERFSVSFVAGSNADLSKLIRCYIYAHDGVRNGAEGTILVDDMQVEVAPFASSYIPTTSTTVVTRPAESCRYWNMSCGSTFTSHLAFYAHPQQTALYGYVFGYEANTNNRRWFNGYINCKNALVGTGNGITTTNQGAVPAGGQWHTSTLIVTPTEMRHVLDGGAAVVGGLAAPFPPSKGILRLAPDYSDTTTFGLYAPGAPDLGIPAFDHRAWSDSEVQTAHASWLAELSKIAFPY